MNSYELSRKWFNYCFDNPEKIKPIHTAIYFFSIEHCNRLGWKHKFGFPSQMVMEAVGVKNWRTYSKALNELVEFGFIDMIEVSKNQYSSNIIAIVKNTKAPTKALDKALQKHDTKQGQSTVSIDKQLNNKQETNNKGVGVIISSMEKRELFNIWLDYRKDIKKSIKNQKTLDTLVKKFNEKSIEELRYVVYFSIENQYQGLIWDKWTPTKVIENKWTNPKRPAL